MCHFLFKWGLPTLPLWVMLFTQLLSHYFVILVISILMWMNHPTLLNSQCHHYGTLQPPVFSLYSNLNFVITTEETPLPSRCHDSCLQPPPVLRHHSLHLLRQHFTPPEPTHCRAATTNSPVLFLTFTTFLTQLRVSLHCFNLPSDTSSTFLDFITLIREKDITG